MVKQGNGPKTTVYWTFSEVYLEDSEVLVTTVAAGIEVSAQGVLEPETSQ